MGEKTINIIEVVTSKNIYTVGAVPEGLTDAVEKINFFPSSDPYNKNRNYEGSCYVVYFVNEGMRRIVPVSEVKDVGVLLTEKETKKKTTHPEAIAFEATGENNE